MSKKNKVRVKPKRVPKSQEFEEGKSYVFSYRKYKRQSRKLDSNYVKEENWSWEHALIGVVFKADLEEGSEVTQVVRTPRGKFSVSRSWCIELKGR